MGLEPSHSRSSPHLVLASASARRHELIARLKVRFVVSPTEIPEVPASGESPRDAALRLASEKLHRAAAEHPGSVCLTADTVVDLNGEVLGKPVTANHAVQMLQRLRGRSHLVHTAVGMASSLEKELIVSTTCVEMRTYSDEEIAEYVASGDPMDKAGAYAIQSPEFRPVSAFTGSYSNVMGLPLAETARLLTRFGFSPVYDPEMEAHLAAEVTGARARLRVP